MTAVSNLSEAITSLAESVKNKKEPSIGRVGANIRYVLGVLDELQPTIAAGSGMQSAADMSPCIDAFSKAFELEASQRLD